MIVVSAARTTKVALLRNTRWPFSTDSSVVYVLYCLVEIIASISICHYLERSNKVLQCVVKQYGRMDMFVGQFDQVTVVRKKYHLGPL